MSFKKLLWLSCVTCVAGGRQGPAGLHSVDVTGDGQPLTVVSNHILWYRGK